jgi:lysozyme
VSVKNSGWWLAKRTRARVNHQRYVFLSKRSKTGTKRHEKLMARRVHWWREYQRADRVYRRRLKQEPQGVSQKGLEFLVREEGVVPYAYQDSEGWVTFGVGHLVQPQHKGITATDRAKWGTKTSPRSRAFVLDLLDRDLDGYEDTVRRSITRPMKQREFDAMVSLCFNIGQGGFASSSVVKRFNSGDTRGAADAFRMWNTPSVLGPRRERERSTFLGS